jgi:hypothetical protein
MANTTLVYNDVEIDVIETVVYDKRPFYDSRKAYLWTVVTLVVRGWFNPDATSFVFNPDGDPVEVPRQLGAKTDTVVRHALSQPRGQLTYTIGGQVVLDSPGIDISGGQGDTDMNNGPEIIGSPKVLAVHGSKTLHIEFGAITYINESPLFALSTEPPGLLAHNWSRSEYIDSDYRSTIRTEGRAYFNEQILEATTGGIAAGAIPANYVPDDWRNYLFHPVPVGFKRTNIQVLAQEDGTALAYSFEDKEVDISIVQAGITDIKCILTIGAGRPDIITGSTLAGFDLVNDAIDSVLGNPSAAVIAARAAARAAAQLAVKTANRLIPLMPFSIRIGEQPIPYTSGNVVTEVWGTNGTARTFLSSVAYTIADQCFRNFANDGVFGARNLYTLDVSETWDMMGTYVRLQMGLYGSGVGGISSTGTPVLTNLFPTRSRFQGNATTGGGLIATQFGPGQNPPVGKSRGFYRGVMAANALQDQDSTPTAAADPRNARNVTAP